MHKRSCHLTITISSPPTPRQEDELQEDQLQEVSFVSSALIAQTQLGMTVAVVLPASAAAVVGEMFVALLLTDAPAQTSAIVVAIAHCEFDAAAAVAVAVEATAVAREGDVVEEAVPS